MNLSFREKSLWGSVAAMVAVYGYYFTRVIRTGAGENFARGQVSNLVSPVIMVIAINIVYNVALALIWKPEPKDERDRLIEGKSYAVAYVIMVTGALTSMWAVAWLIDLQGQTFPPAIPPAPAFITGNLLFFFLVVAEVAKSLTQLFYYRRGV